MNHNKLSYIMLLILMLSVFSYGDEIVRLEHAHAHNDYNHENPLFDALDNGFTSIEADIFLKDGELRVAHNYEDIIDENTLLALYIEPLVEILKEGENSKYYSLFPIILLIDIKREGENAYKLLEDELAPYEEYLTTYENDVITHRKIDVIISGKRPVEYMESQSKRLAGVDGRLENIEDSAYLFPLISDKYKNAVGSASGDDEIKATLTSLADSVHNNGKIIRLWSTPSTETSWKIQYEAGLDLIGTDDLVDLKNFFLGLTTAIDDNKDQVEREYNLLSNYPNPFNNSTKIEFVLPQQSYVGLSVYNMQGQKVADLVNGNMNSGRHVVDFKVTNLSSGVYFYTLKTGNNIATKKMLYLK